MPVQQTVNALAKKPADHSELEAFKDELVVEARAMISCRESCRAADMSPLGEAEDGLRRLCSLRLIFRRPDEQQLFETELRGSLTQQAADE